MTTTTTTTTATATATATEAAAPAYERALVWVTAIGNGLAVLTTRYPPFTDVPEHVASMATIARMIGGESTSYEIAFGSSQYILYHVVGALLTRVTGDAALANQLLLAAIGILWPLSFRSLLRATGRDPRLAVFAAMTLWCRPLQLGLLPFIASVVIAMFALGLLVRNLDATTHRLRFALGIVALALFYTHASAWLLFAVVSAAWCAAYVLQADHKTRRERTARSAITATTLVPSVVAALCWWRSGSLGRGVESIDHLPIRTSLRQLPIWTFDVWGSHVDEVCAGAWWTAFALLVLYGVVRAQPKAQKRRLPLIVPFACAALLYLLTPFHVGAASMLNLRLSPILVTFALLPLELRRDRPSAIAVATAGVASLVMSANAAFEMRRTYREVVGDADVVLAALRPGARLAMLNFQKSSPRTHDWPYIYLGSYYRAHGGDVASWSFTELRHWPLRYAPGKAPPTRPAFWSFNPCVYRYGTDGAYYDYVLAQGGDDPFPGSVPDPLFEPIAHTGRFTLFAKRNAVSRDEGTVDRGPCP